MRLVFFVVADRFGDRRQRATETARAERRGGGENRKLREGVGVSWGATSGSEWREKGERPAAAGTTKCGHRLDELYGFAF